MDSVKDWIELIGVLVGLVSTYYVQRYKDNEQINDKLDKTEQRTEKRLEEFKKFVNSTYIPTREFDSLVSRMTRLEDRIEDQHKDLSGKIDRQNEQQNRSSNKLDRLLAMLGGKER